MASSSCLATQNCSNLTGNEQEPDFVPGFYVRRDTFPIVIAILIIIVNCWVLALVAMNRSLRTVVSNYILTSLAASDLCMGAISIPLYLSCNITLELGFCVADMVMVIFVSVSTVLHILVMTIDRYICIIYALRYRSWVNKRRVFHVIALIWFISMFMGLIQLTWVEFNSDITDDYDADVDKIIIIYDIFRFVVFVAIPVVFMAFTYAHILYEVHRQTKNIQKHNTPGWQESRRITKQEWKVATIFLVMLIVFIICWVPYYLMRIEELLGNDFFQLNFSNRTLIVIYWLRLCTSLINPCLYILGKPDFRKAAGLRRTRKRRYNSELTRNSLLKSSSV